MPGAIAIREGRARRVGLTEKVQGEDSAARAAELGEPGEGGVAKSEPSARAVHPHDRHALGVRVELQRADALRAQIELGKIDGHVGEREGCANVAIEERLFCLQ